MKITLTTKLGADDYFTDEIYLCKSDVVKFIEDNLDKIDNDYCMLISKEKTKNFQVCEVYQ